ncbi:MAG: hypothetical protein ACKO9G_12905 [Dolichospermum sp.]
MPAPQALHDLTLYLIKAENAVLTVGDKISVFILKILKSWTS